MTTKLYRIESGAIDASGDASAYSDVIRGKILAVHVNYPANTCTVDLDTADNTVSDKILDLSAASTDATYYPRVAVCDNTGTAVDLSDAQGGNTAQYEKFAVNGRILLTIASGTQGQEVTVDIIVEI